MYNALIIEDDSTVRS